MSSWRHLKACEVPGPSEHPPLVDGLQVLLGYMMLDVYSHFKNPVHFLRVCYEPDTV